MEPLKRHEREQRASRTLHRDIPELFRAIPRAEQGISKTELIRDPSASSQKLSHNSTDSPRDDLVIRVQPTDALQAAARCSTKQVGDGRRRSSALSSNGKTAKVAVHSMGSLTRPGGGFMSGANGQEEFLCTRTTLYASLWDKFYPLPELGGIYTPDVLVFRGTDGVELARRDRFFVDVITAGVARHPVDRSGEGEEGCSCGVSYCDEDRDIMASKMKAILRIAQSKGVQQLILGDWGCGPLRHPVREVAKLWRKVLVGGARQRRANAEQWEGIQEVIFAIPNSERAREFRATFEDVLAADFPSATPSRSSNSPDARRRHSDEELEQLLAEVTSLELQIDRARNASLRQQLRDELSAVMRELALQRAERLTRDDSGLSEDDDGDALDYTLVGKDSNAHVPYHFDTTSSSEDTDSGFSQFEEINQYQFGSAARDDERGGQRRRFSTSEEDDDDDDDDSDFDEFDDNDFDWRGYYSLSSSSPRMTPDGWFQGSIDELSQHLYGSKCGSAGAGGEGARESFSPLRSPLLVRVQSNGTNGPAVNHAEAEEDAALFDGLLDRFQRTGMS